jgi:CelD/BcsL family acetyltransferase involved in cellulose biosynthesis
MKARGRHEAIALAALHFRTHELGCRCRSVLLPSWKEGRLVEEQVLTRSQAIARTGLQVEVVSDVDRFNSLAADWDRLVNRWSRDRVFLSHAWFRTWWESFGGSSRLHVITVRAKGELVAAAPLMRTRASFYGLRLDAIQAIYNPHTPRYDLIVGDNYNPILYRAIWKEIADNGASEAVIFSQIPSSSPSLAIFEDLAKDEGWLTGQWHAPPSPFISLEGDYERFFNSLKNSSRYNLRKRYERLKRKGPVDVEVVTDFDAVQRAMNDGLSIEASAWKGRQGTAIVSDPVVREFYIRLAEREAEAGRLQLTFLRVGGKRIAFSYLLRSGKRLYAVKIGYDRQYRTYSPGNMLLNLVIKEACAQGIDEYDFLGADDEWKFEWTSRKRDHRWLFLFRDTWRGQLSHHLKFNVVPVVKPQLNAICAYLEDRT